MPFAGYDDFDACVRENSDKDNPEAYCGAIKNQVEGNLEELSDKDREAAMEEMRDMGSRINVARTLEVHEETQRITEGSDGAESVRYTNIKLLSPGEWTDAKSRTTYFYSPRGIKNSVDNWEDNKLHLNHDGQDTVLADIGHVDTESVYANEQGEMIGDIVFHRRTQDSRDAEALMELAYDTEGEQGLGGPSVEIVDAQDEWDADRGLMETVEMTFSGVGLVTSPASQTAAFSKQFAAMQDNLGEKARLMQKAKGVDDKDESMSAELAEEVETLREQVRELKADRGLMDYDTAVEMLSEYVGEEGTSREDTLGDVIEWMNSMEMDADEVAYVTEAGDHLAAMEEVDVDTMEEIPVGMAIDSLQSMDMEEYEDEEEEDDEMDMSELESQISSLESDVSELSETITELRGVTEQVSELAGVVKEVSHELEEFKNEPQDRTLSSHDPGDSDSWEYDDNDLEFPNYR